MTSAEIAEKLIAQFGERVGPLQEAFDPFVVVAQKDLVEVCTHLRDTPGLEMDFLQDETAVDYPEESLMRMVYHLFSYQHRHGLVLKVECDRTAPSVPTVEGVWPVANWFEREIHELFGIAIEGHSDLRALMLPDDWEGHPLRKDYEEQTSYHGIDHDRFSPIDGYTELDEMARKIAASTAEQIARATEVAPATGQSSDEASGEESKA